MLVEAHSLDLDEIRPRLLESPNSEQNNAQTLPEHPRTIEASEEVVGLFEEVAVLLLQLASHVPEIKPKVDILIADCEDQLGPIAMVSRSSEKFCWACGYSDRDVFEESQNPCSFC